jgi:hypothetical protein
MREDKDPKEVRENGLVFPLFWAKAKSRSSFFAGGERSFYDSNPTLRQL